MAPLTAVLYHAVSASESDFERGLGVVTRPERFESHIRYFEKHYDIVDLDAVLNGPLPRRPLLITFDDFYASVIALAREILKPRGIPSLFFVNPNLLGKDAIGIDNVLAFCVNKYGLAKVCEAAGVPPRSMRSIDDLITQVAATKSSAARARLKSILLDAFGLEPRETLSRCPIADPSELTKCAGLGIEIGNHTATHVHGRSLTSEELHSEIVTAKEKLETLAGVPVRAFSLPYGSERDLTAPVLQTIRESGHRAIFLVHARSNLLRKAPDIWYRTSLRNEADSKLSRKLTLLPLMRSVKHRLAG